MRALLTGWFSFEHMGATAGDLMARDLTAEWLEKAECPYDVALAPPFGTDVEWESVDPDHYSHLIFVCGPFGNGPPVDRLFERFERCTLVGLNLSMLENLDSWNPFDYLWERNSSAGARADISFLASTDTVPVVGIVQVDPQEEYGTRARHEQADAAIDRLRETQEMAAVPIDTRLDANRTGLRSPAEVVTLIGRMDAVVTTRLHGMVLALKNEVPPVAVDPIAGGAKISRQAEVIGWPVCLQPGDLTDSALEEAFELCLTEAAQQRARTVRNQAVDQVRSTMSEFIETFQ